MCHIHKLQGLRCGHFGGQERGIIHSHLHLLKVDMYCLLPHDPFFLLPERALRFDCWSTLNLLVCMKLEELVMCLRPGVINTNHSTHTHRHTHSHSLTHTQCLVKGCASNLHQATPKELQYFILRRQSWTLQNYLFLACCGLSPASFFIMQMTDLSFDCLGILC